jgi:hypothetical protein
VAGVVEEFTSVPVIELPLPAAPPVIPPVTTGADQLYDVPAGIILGNVLTGVTVNGVPLQIARGMFAIEGRGFTVTVSVNVLEH